MYSDSMKCEYQNANENEVIFYFIQQQRKSTIVSTVRIGKAAIATIVSFLYTSDIGQHLSIQYFLRIKKYAFDDWSQADDYWIDEWTLCYIQLASRLENAHRSEKFQ